MRLPTQAGYDLIRRWEAFMPAPYLCPAGVWTIGYGCTFDALGDPVTPRTRQVTEAEAQAMLEREVLHFAAAVERLCPVDLTDGQFDALTSFTYNLGAGALQASTLRHRLLERDYAGAAEQFPRWCWAAGRKLTGLLNRRMAERSLFLGA